MNGKLKQPKLTGMKIYCNTCKRDNPLCKHYDNHVYRIRLHVKGSGKGVRVKTLESRDYDDALDEAIAFKKNMEKNNYQVKKVSLAKPNNTKKAHSLVSAILKYDLYLDGRHELIHLRKEVSKSHRSEMIRFCTYFSDVVKKTDNIARLPIAKVTQQHVADFYGAMETEYAPSTFNKIMAAMKAFFEFIITVERVKMDNPFSVYVTKEVGKQDIKILTKDEFAKVLAAIETAEPIAHLSNGVRKTMYYPYLKVAFKLFLLTGGRREEVVDLKWSDMMIVVDQTRFFAIENKKVVAQKKSKNIKAETPLKYFPVNVDLFNLLLELGYEEFKGQDRFILFPEREVTSKTLMDRISKSFTYYRKAAGITKEISLDELRKTYLSWLNAVMNKDTRILSSHASEAILEGRYVSPTILSSVKKAELEFRVFGT